MSQGEWAQGGCRAVGIISMISMRRCLSMMSLFVGALFTATALATSELDSPGSNTSNDRSRYVFDLEKGAGTPVCDAYLQRLNETRFESPPFCDRPENDRIPGFSLLHRIPLSPAETARLYPRILTFLGSRTSTPPHPLDEYATAQAASGGQGPVIFAWRYAARLDIENDGHARNVIVWTGPPFSELNRPCGSMPEDPRLTEPLRRNQLAFVLSDDGLELDDGRTQALFGHSPAAERQTVQFEPLGFTFDLFEYRDQIYFDTFFDEPQSRRDRLAVFVRREGVTHQVCQYLYRGKRPMKGAKSQVLP
jgi:hypothetical protein